MRTILAWRDAIASSPEEVQRWFKEDEELKARMEAIINRRYIKNCEKCGKEIPLNTQYTEAGGDAYHDECWRKLAYGQKTKIDLHSRLGFQSWIELRSEVELKPQTDSIIMLGNLDDHLLRKLFSSFPPSASSSLRTGVSCLRR